MVKPAFTYMKVLKELCKELFFTTNDDQQMRLLIFARKVIRNEVHKFILDFYQKFEEGEIKLHKEYESYFYYYA